MIEIIFLYYWRQKLNTIQIFVGVPAEPEVAPFAASLLESVAAVQLADADCCLTALSSSCVSVGLMLIVWGAAAEAVEAERAVRLRTSRGFRPVRR